MRLHPKLLLLCLINFLGAVGVLFMFNIGSTDYEARNYAIIEMIPWLCFFFAFFPSFIRPDVRAEWYSKKYIYGSVFLFLSNVFIPVLSSFVFLKLFR